VSEKLCALRLIRAAEVAEAAVEETLAQNDPRQGPFARNTVLPLPAVYGVYAINNGRLSELDPLSIRIPDQMVFMSALIMNSSRVNFLTEKLLFWPFDAILWPMRPASRQSARAAATSGRSCSEACCVFFEREVQPVERPPHSALAH